MLTQGAAAGIATKGTQQIPVDAKDFFRFIGEEFHAERSGRLLITKSSLVLRDASTRACVSAAMHANPI